MNKQKGFSAVVVLLSILVVTALGFTGYYVYNTQKNKENSTNEMTTNPQKTVNNESTTNSAKEDEAQKYISIKEFAVKIPTDTMSEITTNYVGDDTNTVKLIALGECPVGNIIKSTSLDKEYAGDTIKNQFTAGMISNQLNGYYYIFQPFQGAGAEVCNNDQAVMQKTEAYIKYLSENMKKTVLN